MKNTTLVAVYLISCLLIYDICCFCEIAHRGNLNVTLYQQKLLCVLDFLW